MIALMDVFFLCCQWWLLCAREDTFFLGFCVACHVAIRAGPASVLYACATAVQWPFR